jgi:hypothetical protein
MRAPTPFFGIDPQARLDYGYQAVGKLTPMAKSRDPDRLRQGPDRSYIGGCSNGGRHTMVAASRYADQYDGFLVGDPGFRLPLAAIANIAGAKTYASLATTPGDLGTGFTQAERALVSNAVLAKCDALDGAADGLVQDTKACQAAFDLNRDVPTCSGARDGTCLSAAQKTGIAACSPAPPPSSGAKIYSSFPYDAAWARRLVELEVQRAAGARFRRVGLIWEVPPEDPASFNGANFALNGDLDTMLAKVNATNATYHGKRHVLHDAAEPVQPRHAEEPRRQDDGLPRHQRPDLLERRHHRLVRTRCARRTAATHRTSRASSACPA